MVYHGKKGDSAWETVEPSTAGLTGPCVHPAGEAIDPTGKVKRTGSRAVR